MKITYWPDNEDEFPAGCVATIGVFDGVHSGHRRILYELVTEAEDLNTDSVVITFDRLPGEITGSTGPTMITSLAHRLKLFAKLGVDWTIVIRFSPEIANLAPEEFAGRFLKEKLAVRKLILGFDGRFGKDRKGGVKTCRNLDIPVRKIHPLKIEGEVVSSTSIRRAIQEGDLFRAAKLLGRPYSIIGKVVHGDSMGTRIGFPTANIRTDNGLLLKEGVYAGRAYLDDSFFDAAISVGKRPTVHKSAEQDKAVLEAYLINEHINLYGKGIEVQFLQFLRDQIEFAGIEDLKLQIERDVEKTKYILKSDMRLTETKQYMENNSL